MTDYNVEGRLITKDDWEKWLKSKEEESAKKESRYAVIEWHPYPEDKPNSLARSYLVTGIYKKKRKVSISNWYKSQNVFDKEGLFSVIAWAEMPEPYEEENNE